MTLEDYVNENYPELAGEFKRKTTPFYYEPNVLYHPITSGFGCDRDGSREPFLLTTADYLKDGDMYITMVSQTKKDHKCSIALSEAHKKIKRLDDDVKPIGAHIPNSRKRIYMTVNGVGYTIYQAYWRNYTDKTLGGRISIHRDIDEPCKTWSNNYRPYYELYSHFGSVWHYKHVKGYDNMGREDYDIKFNVSVRQFKEKVFGDPNIKFKCKLFGDL